MSDADDFDDPEILDPELVEAFLEESEESLEEAVSQLVELESAPQERDRLNAIFRAFHSLKGNASFFGLMKIKQLAHRLEDVLSLMREDSLAVSREVTGTLLTGVDQLRAMLGRVHRQEPEVPDDGLEALSALLEELTALCDSAAEQEVDLWPKVLVALDAIMKKTEGLSEVHDDLRRLRDDLRHLAPQRGSSAPPEIEQSGDPLERLITLLEEPILDQLSLGGAQVVGDCLRALCEREEGEARVAARQALADYESVVSSVGFVPLLQEILLEKVDAVRAARRRVSGASDLDDSEDSIVEDGNEVSSSLLARGPSASSGKQSIDSPNRTMRVAELKIDQFLDYVGELIIVREMFGNVGKRLRSNLSAAEVSSEYQRALEAFTALSHDLQNSIMEVRKVPVKTILKKVPRVIRDLSDGSAKDAKVSLAGTEVTLDKSLVEAFEAPLMHMVRNAFDHGLESMDTRESSGKSRQGTITVSVEERADEVLFLIRDDGRGIDRMALRDKAIRLGLLNERDAERQSAQADYDLLFSPGLSTAKTVTDISGRGVGMDVVKRSVADLGGRIEVSSAPGAGTSFEIHLPKTVTLQILDGFLVRVGTERFVLPLQAINESFRPAEEHLHVVAARGECITRRGRVVPLVRFADLLKLPSRHTSPCDGIVVSVEVAGGNVAGLMVDDVLGVQQVVLREVEGLDARNAPFSGGAVLGDGRVAMVVNVEHLNTLVA